MGRGGTAVRQHRVDEAQAIRRESDRRDECHGPGLPVTAQDQRPRIVAEDGLRHAPEMDERRRDAFAPVILSLVQERLDEYSPGVAEDGDQQKDRHQPPGDLEPLLAEVHLQLGAGRRFHPHRRHIGRARRLAHGGDHPLHRPDTRLTPLRGQQLLHHDGIALRRARE
jgi:hypothetical protein